MKQENKDLLIKDLCARLPYGVKAEYKNEKFVIEYVSPMYEDVKLDNYETWTVGISDVKPYLFPLSSMTEEHKKEYESLCIKETSEYSDLHGIIFAKDHYYDTVESIDYLYKNHIDVRGLIPMGLAIDCTNLNIY